MRHFDPPIGVSHETVGLSLFLDESLSSWKRRNPHLWRAMEMTALSFRDGDFGQLRLKEPLISDQLFLQLQRSAEAPDPWLLLPWNKQFCPRCWGEDWVSGQIPYARRSWRIAWRTCCPKHGLYELVKKENERLFRFPLDCSTLPRWNRPEEVQFKSRRSMWTNLVLGKDLRLAIVGRRAIHIESALEGQSHSPRWYPYGIERSLLRPAYASVVKALMKQFSLDLCFARSGKLYPPTHQRRPNRFKSEVWRDLGLFYHLGPSERFALNVLVEAILSNISDSPLPGDAGAHRHTQNLVRAINWDIGPPGTPVGTLPFESLMQLVNADLRAKSQPEANAVAAPHTLPTEESQRLRLQKMRQFYQRRRILAEALAGQNSRKIKAGRDLREKDNNKNC